MNIPDEAVEAAADGLQQFSLTKDRDGLQAWDAYARAALVEAAPFILAQAVEDREVVEERVRSIVQEVAMTVDCTDRLHAAVQEIMAVTNPYRSQA